MSIQVPLTHLLSRRNLDSAHIQEYPPEMGLKSFSSSSTVCPGPSGETVIVVMDANRTKIHVVALDWALKHAIRPGDTVIVLGIFCDIIKKPFSCFPFCSGEKLELSVNSEEEIRELEEEIANKKEEYKISLQPFYQYCKRNEVKMEIKIAAGFFPRKVAVEGAKNHNTSWIVLDSHLKRDKTYIYRHAGCNVALVKGKNVVTLMTLEVPHSANSPEEFKREEYTNCGYLQSKNVLEEESRIPTPQRHSWYPLSQRTGFPRSFTQNEMEVMTNGFSDENIVSNENNIKIYRGIFQETPVLVKCFLENDERFWSMLKILSRVRHRHIMNLVGYCFMRASMLLLFDYPCMGTLETNLQCNDSAKEISWKARWYIAVEIGTCMRYLHEESVDGPIVHLSVCSRNVVYSHGCSAMLANFITAKCLKGNGLTSLSHRLNPEKAKHLSVDVRDYGTFLLELITGKSAHSCLAQGKDLVCWALPAIRDGSLLELIDCRLSDDSDSRLVHNLVQAASLCLSNAHYEISMSEVLAVARGHQVPMQGHNISPDDQS